MALTNTNKNLFNNKINKSPIKVSQNMLKTTNKKEKKIELVDGSWKVSDYVNEKQVILNKVDKTHNVSIFNCENTTFVINAEKFKSIQISKCTKCNFILKNIISMIEIINSTKTKIQVTGKCSSVAIDKSIGVDIFLSKHNEETEFTTALSAEMHVHVENKNSTGDWKEITIPEQYQHILNKGNMKTRVSDLYKF